MSIAFPIYFNITINNIFLKKKNTKHNFFNMMKNIGKNWIGNKRLYIIPIRKWLGENK